MISAREAMESAVDWARKGDWHLADTWTHIAAELRAGETRPAVDRILDRARQTLPPEPGDRLTLHDVEGKVCPGGHVAIRRRGLGEWWMHTEGRTSCACEPASASEPPTTRMDLRGEATTQLGLPLRRQPGSGRDYPEHGSCMHCGHAVYLSRSGVAITYRHDINDQVTCPVQSGVDAAGDETFVHTMAWPAAIE